MNHSPTYSSNFALPLRRPSRLCDGGEEAAGGLVAVRDVVGVRRLRAPQVREVLQPQGQATTRTLSRG